MIPAPDAAIDTAEAAPPETEPVEAVVLTSPAPAELVLPAPAELVLPAPAGPATPAVADSAPRPGRRGSSAPHFRILQCKRCGYYVKPTTLFCPACGKWRRLAYAVLAGVLLLLALLGVAAVLWLPRLKLGAAQARGASSHGAEARGYVRNTRAGGVTLYSLISRGGRSPAAGAVRPQVASTRGAAATAHAAGPLHDRPAAAPAALR